MRVHAPVALMGALLTSTVLAHSGGVDKDGCHTSRKTGQYHCHRGEQAPRGELRGQVSVIDGDSLEMGRKRIRLYGIDAVESDQTCGRQDKKRWPCGRRAAFALADFIARQAVTCLDRGKDNYGRILATCSVPAGEINDWLVRQGWAVAYTRYSSEYVAAEAEARNAKRNIWSGTFMQPERYRRRE